MAKYKEGVYDKGYFRAVIIRYLNLITYENNIVICLILKCCVLHWYHMHILHPGMDRKEAIFSPTFVLAQN